MSVFDNFREFFAMRFSRIDRRMQEHAKGTAEDLKDRFDRYAQQVDQELIDHIRSRIAEEEKLDQLEHTTPAPLPPPAEPTGDAELVTPQLQGGEDGQPQEQPEATAPPVEASGSVAPPAMSKKSAARRTRY